VSYALRGRYKLFIPVVVLAGISAKLPKEDKQSPVGNLSQLETVVFKRSIELSRRIQRF
jgi:hypothetical protein